MVLRLLGGSTGPLQMLLSLLLMQGISLTMFRAFLRHNISRSSDPLRFNFNLGNTNATNGGGGNNAGPGNVPASGIASLFGASGFQSPLSSLMFPVTNVPTPAPPIPPPLPQQASSSIVDPKMLDLITLIRALMPANAQTGNNQNGGLAGSVQAPAASIIALPLQTITQQQSNQLQQLQAAPSFVLNSQQQSPPQPVLPAQSHIIIVPQLMKTSASDYVQTISKKPEMEENDEKKDKEEDEEEESKNKITRKHKRKNSSKTIVFEAVSSDNFDL